MPSRAEIESIFYPKVVAVVGASNRPQRHGGTRFLIRLQRAGFSGPIYPINPNAEEVRGLTAYASLKEVPEPVDLAIVAVPAEAVPGVLEDCIAAGVRNVHLYTAGFTETGLEERRGLEGRVRKIALRGGLRIVGPNGMGPYCSASRLAAWGEPPEGVGPVGFISQSGGHAEHYFDQAEGLGICFSKVVSFGNGLVLESADFLDYLGADPETEVIGMYLEGVRQGRRLFQLVREINPVKPIIIWKGGLTSWGARAAASHTGSLAGEEAIWQAFFRQTGAVPAHSVEEIADVTLAFLHLSPPRGRRVVVVGGGGGNSVSYADVCAREGLEVPALGQDTIAELRQYVPIAGTSVRNPLDAGVLQENAANLKRTLNLVAKDPLIDLIIVDRHTHWDDHDQDPEDREAADQYLIDFAHHNPFSKPLVVTVSASGNDSRRAAEAAELRRKFARAGLPSYPTQQRAARALARFIGYHEFRRS